MPLHNLPSGRRLRDLGRAPGAQQPAFLPDGATLATAAGDGSLALWGTATGEALGRWRGADAPAIVALSPDAAWLAVAPIDQNGAVAAWRRP